MTTGLKELVQNLVHYYDAHGINNFVFSDDARLKGFVADDFSKLLNELRKGL